MSIPVSIAHLPGGRLRLKADVAAGLHALSITADASDFDWRDLYIIFNCYGNTNQRTGPWDFNELEENRPVMPAYWVFLNGRKLGLWYFNRLSSEEVTQKRFSAELGFYQELVGSCELEFIPYREFTIRWDDVDLRPDPYDRLEAIDPPTMAEHLLPDQMPRNRFTAGFMRAIEFFRQQLHTERNSGFQLPSLAAAWHWERNPEDLLAVRQIIESYLALPAWGNPREDGYGHNGDMAAATPLFGIATALRWIGSELDDLRPAILARLERQGDALLEAALFYRGYWGGCLLQDHGIVTMSWFACAAYLLSDLLPASRRWLSFAVPRVLRSFDAMPQDGIVPETSYRRLWMYADKFPLFRELHRQAGGEDIYLRPSIRAIPGAVRALRIDESGDYAFPFTYSDIVRSEGGHAFLAQLADMGNRDACFLLERFMQPEVLEAERDSYEEWHFQKDWLWALIFHRDHIAGLPELSSIEMMRKSDSINGISSEWFCDTGAGVLRASGSLLVAHCGPPVSHSSYPKLTCCNDRAVAAPLSGNFVYISKGRPVLHTAEGGYRQESAVGNVLLVNGAGQKGDQGMPMSYPNFKYHGERIADVDASHGIQMDLTPAYHTLERYHRTLHLDATGALLLDDEVSCPAGQVLTWLFQSSSKNHWSAVDDKIWKLRVEDTDYLVTYSLEVAESSALIGETLSVWSYVSACGNIPCHHLAIQALSLGSPVRLKLRLHPA